MSIKIWQERLAESDLICLEVNQGYAMRAEIDELRAALSAKLVPMTFNEVEMCFPAGGSTDEYGQVIVSAQWLHDFAHAVEAHHGIKGE